MFTFFSARRHVRFSRNSAFKSFSTNLKSSKAKVSNSKTNSNTELWELIVGTEVHAQISTTSKLFSGSGTTFASPPNSQVAWEDAGMPGALPALNQACVDKALKIGIALNGQVNSVSMFERKHYSYCDLPLGYQITQQAVPIIHDAKLDISDLLKDMSQDKAIRIERIQLEIDSGKNLHDVHPSSTYVDLNRSGMPLLEIVSKPDMRSVDEVMAFVKKLSGLLKHLEVCHADMSKSQLRVDLNISVRPKQAHPDFSKLEPFIEGSRDENGRGLGTRVEVKNLNSLKAMASAIQFEFNRQIDSISSGSGISRETRSFDVSRGETIKLRSKEDLLDYRFCPDPDLPPLVVTEDLIEQIRNSIPELPEQIAKRWNSEFGMNKKETGIIVSDPDFVKFFESILHCPPPVSATPSEHLSHNGPLRNPQRCGNWMVTELFGRLNSQDIPFTNCPVSPAQIASIVDSIDSGVISGAIGKKVLDLMMKGDRRIAQDIVTSLNWALVTDPVLIDSIISSVLAEHPKQVNEFITTNATRIFDFMVGVALKKLQFKVSPTKVADAMKQQLSSTRKL